MFDCLRHALSSAYDISLSRVSLALSSDQSKQEKKKQQPILTSKETSTELFTGLSPQSLIIDAGYDPWVSVDAVKHDTIETKKNLLSTRTTHTRSQCKVIFLNPQQLEEQQIIPGPTMSSEVIRRL